jgi:hypothetical protein
MGIFVLFQDHLSRWFFTNFHLHFQDHSPTPRLHLNEQVCQPVLRMRDCGWHTGVRMLNIDQIRASPEKDRLLLTKVYELFGARGAGCQRSSGSRQGTARQRHPDHERDCQRHPEANRAIDFRPVDFCSPGSGAFSGGNLRCDVLFCQLTPAANGHPHGSAEVWEANCSYALSPSSIAKSPASANGMFWRNRSKFRG